MRKQIHNQEKMSAFQKYSRILGYEKADILTKDETLELKRMGQISLKPLTLTKEQPDFLSKFSFIFAPQYMGLAVTAVLSLVVMTKYFSSDDLGGVRTKGNSQVNLYFERGGVESSFSAGDKLISGDKVRIEFSSAAKANGYVTVLDRAGVELLDLDSVVASKVALKPGSRESSGTALLLDNVDQGEKVVAALCEDTFERSALAEFKRSSASQLQVGGCQFFSFDLR